MKALIESINCEKEIVTVKGSLRQFLNNHYDDHSVLQITFFKEKFGSSVKCADVFFSHPYRIVLYYQWLTVTEQKQFISFLSDHLSTSIYSCPFSLEMNER